MQRVPRWEALHGDFREQGVRFYYIYKRLAHPERNGYVQPFTLKERLLHIREAKRRLGVQIPWLCDNMDNDLIHALGSAPASVFIIDPEGRVAHRRAWANPKEVRSRLVEFVGAPQRQTDPDELNLEFAPPPKHAASGVVPRLDVPRKMLPLVATPARANSETPFYVKLRADADEDLLTKGAGRLYLGFHLDPLYKMHWNNLVDPIRVDLTANPTVGLSETQLMGPQVEVESDIDPREFLISVKHWDDELPIEVTLAYFACNDEQGICLPVTQRYTIQRTFDRDSGWPERRVRPQAPAAKKGPQQ